MNCRFHAIEQTLLKMKKLCALFRNGVVTPKQFDKSELLEVKNSPDGKSNGQAILHSSRSEGIDVTVDIPNGKPDGQSVTHL